MDFSQRLRNARLEAGLTLKDVAKQVGVSAPTIMRYESGRIKNVGKDKILPLAKALHVSPEYLMGWDASELAARIERFNKTYSRYGVCAKLNEDEEADVYQNGERVAVSFDRLQSFLNEEFDVQQEFLDGHYPEAEVKKTIDDFIESELDPVKQRLRPFGVSFDKQDVTYKGKTYKNAYSRLAAKYEISVALPEKSVGALSDSHIQSFIDSFFESHVSLEVPDTITTVKEANAFLFSIPQIAAYSGLDINKLSDEEKIALAQEVANQIRLVARGYE